MHSISKRTCTIISKPCCDAQSRCTEHEHFAQTAVSKLDPVADLHMLQGRQLGHFHPSGTGTTRCALQHA